MTRSRVSNTLNFLLCFGVVVPPALLLQDLLGRCPHVHSAAATSFEHGSEIAACDIFLNHSILCVNLIYFVFVDLGFYLIYIAQGSTWLIDPHWQIIPVCIAAFYFLHPSAIADDGTRHPRAIIAMLLVVAWALRLLHNYFRRERWCVGENEDWRYADMRRAHGKWWILSQFFAVSVAQHCMLVGLTLPLSAAMSTSGTALNSADMVAVALCFSGIAIGYIADNQLYMFMCLKDKPLVLKTGLWKFSRHPNHFGEQTWWVGLLLLGVSAASTASTTSTTSGVFSLTAWWPIAVGVLFNHSVDILVTLPLIEERMLRREERVQAYQEYQRCTSLIIPFPPRRSRDTAKNK